MPGMGPPPKPIGTHTRARSVKPKSTNAVLRPVEAADVKIPTLPPHPEGAWHKQTRDWWKDVWSSPMSAEFDASDKHGLFSLALIVDDFWTAVSPGARQAASVEIRLQSQRYGLSPMDRRRLQWEIEKTEEAQDRGRKRRNAPAPASQAPRASDDGDDPRALLKSV